MKSAKLIQRSINIVYVNINDIIIVYMAMFTHANLHMWLYM